MINTKLWTVGLKKKNVYRCFTTLLSNFLKILWVLRNEFLLDNYFFVFVTMILEWSVVVSQVRQPVMSLSRDGLTPAGEPFFWRCRVGLAYLRASRQGGVRINSFVTIKVRLLPQWRLVSAGHVPGEPSLASHRKKKSESFFFFFFLGMPHVPYKTLEKLPMRRAATVLLVTCRRLLHSVFVVMLLCV